MTEPPSLLFIIFRTEYKFCTPCLGIKQQFFDGHFDGIKNKIIQYGAKRASKGST